MNKVLPLLLLLLLSAPLWADDSVEQLLDGFDDADSGSIEQPVSGTSTKVDELMSGFDESSSVNQSTEQEQIKPQNWTLMGVFSLQGEYGYAHEAPLKGQPDYRGFSHLRSALNLGLDYRFSDQWRGYISGHANYDALVDTDKSEVEINEARLQGQLSANVDLTIGRQIVVWGKSDNLSVTNVLNPIDNRAPGMVDIKDLRLPLAMAKLDYYVGDWGLSTILIPEIRFNKNPTYGTEFYPYPMAMPTEIIPNNGGNNTEVALAANGQFSGWDLSLYHAQLYDDNPYQTMEGMVPVLKHNRIKMNGIAANWVTGSWLLKGEAALMDGLRYSGVNSEYHRGDLLIGVEYNGLTNTSISMELVERTITNYDSVLQSNKDVDKVSRQLAISARRDFDHDRFHLMGLILLNDWKTGNGGVFRLSGEYELSDAMAMTIGMVDYLHANSLPYSGIENNDRLFGRLEYSF
ncbi:MAG: hypothetical protein OEL79_02790 [Chromatiales bacterium]|nr:hypothetical protein [Chromatiales bacterium]